MKHYHCRYFLYQAHIIVYFNLKHILFVFAHWASAFLISYKTLRCMLKIFFACAICAHSLTTFWSGNCKKAALDMCGVCGGSDKSGTTCPEVRTDANTTHIPISTSLRSDYTTATVVTKPWFLSGIRITLLA